jgi:hypothetical protein
MTYEVEDLRSNPRVTPFLRPDVLGGSFKLAGATSPTRPVYRPADPDIRETWEHDLNHKTSQDGLDRETSGHPIGIYASQQFTSGLSGLRRDYTGRHKVEQNSPFVPVFEDEIKEASRALRLIVDLDPIVGSYRLSAMPYITGFLRREGQDRTATAGSCGRTDRSDPLPREVHMVEWFWKGPWWTNDLLDAA